MPAAPPEPLSAARAAELREVIGRLKFVFAKTLAHMPHEYTVRGKGGTEADFAELLDTIKTHGVPGSFGGRRYRYLRPGDGWRYWQIPPYPLINRAVDEP
jgi:hypothetical protein